MDDVPRLLSAVQQGDAKAREELWAVAYHELRSLAARKPAAERDGHTLQPTALVNEGFLRLVGPGPYSPEWQGRGHFFSAAAEAMRRILVESAHRKRRLKRGGDLVSQEFDEALLPSSASDEKILEVHEAILNRRPQQSLLGNQAQSTRLSLRGVSNRDALFHSRRIGDSPLWLIPITRIEEAEGRRICLRVRATN